MKRDMDLIRAILFKIEELEYTGQALTFSLDWDCTDEELEFHVMLAAEAGLVVAREPMSQAMHWAPIRLTWAGYEFIEAARNDTNWARTKDAMGQAGGWVFSVGQQVLVQLMTQIAMQAITGPR